MFKILPIVDIIGTAFSVLILVCYAVMVWDAEILSPGLQLALLAGVPFLPIGAALFLVVTVGKPWIRSMIKSAVR